jgi:predicted membrane protein DUF2339
MDGLLILVFLILLTICWIWLRQRLDEIDSRWSALHERVTAYGFRLDALESHAGRPVVVPTPAAPRPEQRPATQTPPVPVAPMPQAPQPPSERVDVPTPPLTPPRPEPRTVVPAPPVRVSPMPPPPRVEVPVPPPAPVAPPRFTAAPAPAVHRDWEATLGGNWLNKVGVVLLVIGLALALGYSFAHIGPAGRVTVSLAVSFAMLASGAVFEPRPRYRIFARGLLGGGWAALYTTVYAMHAIREARVVESSVLGAVLLFAVAGGMIAHSLRYRSQSVTGLAYFIAFFSLAITQVSWFSVLALVPLAASLLYIAHRFAWRQVAILGLVATYATCGLRGDTGAPLWQAQFVFAIFWLLFEIFDVLQPETWLLPLNAAGFLGLSLLKWNSAAPHAVWMLLAATAAAYLVSSLARTRSRHWHGAATLAAALAAAAIFQRLDHQWIASALVVEAELVYLTGLRLGKPYLRWLGTSLFALELGRLLIFDVGVLPLAAWAPVASLDVAVFYANRALCAADLFYGYTAACVVALIASEEATDQSRGLVWFLAGVAPFLLGWWRRLPDFRIQGYALALLGAAGIGVAVPQPVLALGIVAALSYAARFAAMRLPGEERDALRFAAQFIAVTAVAALVWRMVPGEYLGIAWMAAALILTELDLPLAHVVAAMGAGRVLYFNALSAHNYGPWMPRAIPAAAALMAYGCAWRTRKVFTVASSAGTAFLVIAVWTLLPVVLVGPAWALLAVGLTEFEIPVLRLQAHLVSAAAFTRMFYVNFDEPYRLPSVACVLLSHYYLWWRSRQRAYSYAAAALAVVLMHYEIGRVLAVTGWAPFALALFYAGLRWNLPDLRWQAYAIAALAALQCLYINIVGAEQAVLAASVVIACLFAGQILAPRAGRARIFFALLATALTTVLLYFESSGSMLTVAWGIEGVVLLAAGFVLRDRLLRLPGLALLLGCILKLFVWDLRHLDTLPRIFSFIVLGLILVGVSWIYSRFREAVSRML